MLILRLVLYDTAGSLREPTIKLISFMRAMEFEKEADIPELQLVDLEQKIGQGRHEVPSVFSYFLPEYALPLVILKQPNSRHQKHKPCQVPNSSRF